MSEKSGIQINELDGMTVKAVCFDGVWFPKSQIKFYCYINGSEKADHIVWMEIPEWLIREKLTESQKVRLLVTKFDSDPMMAFTPWTLDIQMDAFNQFEHGYEGTFGA